MSGDLAKHAHSVDVNDSVQTAGTATVPGTSTSSVPHSSAVSWFCPAPAADGMDTLPAAPLARPKDRLRATLFCITKRSASALVDVPESLRMCSDGEVTMGHQGLQPHDKRCLSRDINQGAHVGRCHILKSCIFFI